MTFAQLQYLLEIHKTGSISQAAKNLFVSQPSISLTLKALEAELGYPIFLRTRKGLLPTSQGAAVIDHAARICESYQLLTAPVPHKSTSVRISAASIPPIQHAFLQLVAENKTRRDISFSLTQEQDCIESLHNFTLEIGFILVLTSRHLSYLDTVQKSGLTARVVATLPGAIRIGKGHPQFANPNAAPQDFEDDMFLDSTNSSVSKALLDAGVARIKPNYNIISSQQSVRNALIDKGLAYEISFFVPGEETQADYRYIPLEGLRYKVIAVTNPLHPPVPEIDRFMVLLQQQLEAAGLSKE